MDRPYSFRRYEIITLLTCVGLLLAGIGEVHGVTRWSSLRLVPDADFLGTGEFLAGFDGYITKTFNEEILFRRSVPLRFGITEWVNVECGVCSGFTLGFKARILGESVRGMPSLAIGAHNILVHKETNYFAHDSLDDMANEVYLVLGKSIDAVRTRFHVGIQSIPTKESEKINPFFAVEKYFGLGFYTAFEAHRRNEELHFSLFGAWRTLGDRLELSVGAVELKSMFLNKNNEFEVSLAPVSATAFVKPGIWAGLRFHGKFGKLGKMKGFMSLEDRLKSQDEIMVRLAREVDSLKSRSRLSQSTLSSVQNSLQMLADSIRNDPNRLSNILLNKLLTLKSLYRAEPFEPEKARLLTREIAGFREKAVPVLQDFLGNNKMDRYVRVYSAMMLGEIGSRDASDFLLDVIAQTADPDIKVEILIALGRMKETRAMYLMEQLANDPNEVIAIAAQEVLVRLADETGARISPLARFRKIDPAGGESLANARPGASTPTEADSSSEQGKEDVDAAVASTTPPEHEEERVVGEELEDSSAEPVVASSESLPDSALVPDSSEIRKTRGEAAAPVPDTTDAAAGIERSDRVSGKTPPAEGAAAMLDAQSDKEIQVAKEPELTDTERSEQDAGQEGKKKERKDREKKDRKKDREEKEDRKKIKPVGSGAW